MMKIFFLVLIYFLNSEVLANSCRMSFMEQSKPKNMKKESEVQSTGLGYLSKENDSYYFTFIVCQNRDKCKKLKFPREVEKLYGDVFFQTPALYYITSFFSTFEAGLLNDKKEATKLYKSKSSFENLTGIRCPPKLNLSMHFESVNSLSLNIYKGRKILVNDSMKNCGCEDLIGKNITFKENGYVMDGYFFKSNGKLYFKGSVNDPPKNENSVSKKPVEFFDKIEVVGDLKCNPLAKFIVGQQIEYYSLEPTAIEDSKIKLINLCSGILRNKGMQASGFESFPK